MGYRIYLGSISNKRLKEIKNVSSHEELYKIINNISDDNFDKDDCHCGVYDVVNEKYLHEFGKYIEWTEDLRKSFSKNIFIDKKFNKEYTEENDFFIINKEGLIYIIESMSKELATYYKKMYNYFSLYNIVSKQELNEDDKEEFRKIFCEFKANKYYYNTFGMDIEIDINIDSEFLLKNKEKLNYIRENIYKDISLHFLSELSEYDNRYNLKCYNLDETKKFKITNSWYKDKALLELVHILKTFDFKHNKLVIYGY